MGMFGDLLVGLGFSLAHHFLYNHLNGYLIEESFPSQQWAVRLGTLRHFSKDASCNSNKHRVYTTAVAQV